MLDGNLSTSLLSSFLAITVAAITAYLTTIIKLRSESKKNLEEWRKTILEKYYKEFNLFQKMAQQFAIGVIFYEDTGNIDHHQKIFIPKNFNLTIGRASYNDIKSDDKTVSRMHALLSSSDKDVFIEDLFATNHTIINNEAITCRTKLKDNDKIEIGHVVMRFKRVGGWVG
jgi:hypothetical protein